MWNACKANSTSMSYSDFFARTFKKTISPSISVMEECEACPLTGLPVGQSACLVCVHAGKRLKRRLAEMGLTPGVELVVLQNNGGPLLLSVRDSRLAIGRGMAAKLDVSPLAGARDE